MNPMKPAVLALTLCGLAACSSSKSEQPKLDYQTANRKTVNLEVPPDLTNPNQGNLYQLPTGGSVRASSLNKNTPAVADQSVLKDVKNVHIEGSGNQRWLVIDGKQPAEVWPLLKAFWQESGFVIKTEEPAIGQMETEWAENRAKIPQDSLRNLFEKVGLAGIYSTSERDKFTIRMERGQNGALNVFFAHKGMKEVYADKGKDTTMWQPRPSDANLEAAFLGRFMQYLGADQQQAQQQAQQTASTASSHDMARLDGNTLLLSGDYARNWQRTGSALQRIGFNILGQNTDKHAYLVQRAPAEGDAVSKQSGKQGFFSRMFGKDKKQQVAVEYPQLIVVLEPGNAATRLQLLNKDGSSYKGSDAGSIIGQLHTELR